MVPRRVDWSVISRVPTLAIHDARSILVSYLPSDAAVAAAPLGEIQTRPSGPSQGLSVDLRTRERPVARQFSHRHVVPSRFSKLRSGASVPELTRCRWNTPHHQEAPAPFIDRLLPRFALVTPTNFGRRGRGRRRSGSQGTLNKQEEGA